ncbi:MAG: hypothetical protein AAB349_00055 [Chloroflexota bacterium]
MLTPLDDYLVHQTPETVDRVCTSDRNFYDRYYFSAHTLEGDAYLMVAMGVYPNVGVIDAFATAVIDGKTQYIVRASRELGSDRMNTKVGPIGVEIIEPLRKTHVYTEPNEHGLSFDMVFESVTEPFQEPHFLRRVGNRTFMDYTRMTQNGRWSGTFTAAGRTYAVDPSNWWGIRDHSWGIRPVGGGEPPSAPPPGGAPAGFYWVWAPTQFNDRCLMYTVSEEPDGKRWHAAAELLYPYASGRAPEPLTVAEHDFKLKAGTRLWDRGSMKLLTQDGSPVRITATPKSTLYMAGGGYSYLGGWRHGQYHGPLVVEGEAWDLTDPATIQKAGVHTQTVCDFAVEGLGDIGTGHGVFEFLALGTYLPYGFKTFADVAPA